MSLARRAPLAALVLTLLLPFQADAAPRQTLETRYTISLIGLTVGRADFTTTIDSGRYSVKGRLASAGLADLVSKTSGTSSVEGRIRGDRLYAERYRLAYQSDGKSWASDVRYRLGRSVSSTVSPPLRQPRPADFVQVANTHLRNVVDPLSGLMLKPGRDPSSLCQRSLPVYDGWSRLDLVLSPGGTRPYRTDGFSGDAIACDAKVRPVSGYRKSSSGLKYLQGQTIRIWFAPVGETGIYAPVYIRIPTKIGPLTLNASTFARP